MKYRDCLVLYEVKVELKAEKFYVYPDVLVSCNENDLANKKETIIKHPIVVFEVLSDSTELYDRDKKKHYYLQLPSLKYYLLVSQNETKVEMYEKINNKIEYSYYENSEDVITFQQMDFQLKLDDIYNVN